MHLWQALGQATLSWPTLPYWQGTQPNPGNQRHFPLGITRNQDGILSQTDMGNSIAEVVANYAESDYGFITPPPGTTEWGTRLGEAKLSTLVSFAGSLEGLRILEIGGGNLFLAQCLRRTQSIARYVAVDPALRLWPDESGVEVLRTFFPTPELNGEGFDLVLAHNCLEHIQKPSEFLAAIHRVLIPGGRAFLTFPDVARQFADGDLNAILHEHITYLDEVSARSLFAQAGFDVARWSTSADLASCLLVSSPRSSESVPEGVAPSALLARGVEGFCVRLPRMIEGLVEDIENGRRIAFYGATNGLNSLLDITAIGLDLTILDGDRAKSGRFLPASAQPICWVKEVNLKQFERIYVTAGSFQPEIVKELISNHGVSSDRLVGLFRRD